MFKFHFISKQDKIYFLEESLISDKNNLSQNFLSNLKLSWQHIVFM